MSTFTTAAGGLTLARRDALRQAYLSVVIATACLLPLLAIIIAVSIT